MKIKDLQYSSNYGFICFIKAVKEKNIDSTKKIIKGICIKNMYFYNNIRYF